MKNSAPALIAGSNASSREREEPVGEQHDRDTGKKREIRKYPGLARLHVVRRKVQVFEHVGRKLALILNVVAEKKDWDNQRGRGCPGDQRHGIQTFAPAPIKAAFTKANVVPRTSRIVGALNGLRIWPLSIRCNQPEFRFKKLKMM